MDTRVLMQNDLLKCVQNFSSRCLNKSTEWASDLLISITKDNSNVFENINLTDNLTANQYSRLSMCRSLFGSGFYSRAAYFVKNVKTNTGQFLYFYSQFMEIKKREWEESSKNIGFAYLYTENALFRTYIYENDYRTLLNQMFDCSLQDSYIKYLQGCIYFLLKDEVNAIKVLLEAVNLDPLNWTAWKELTKIITVDNLDIINNQLPRVWVRDFFSLEVEKRIGFMSLSKHSWENFSSLGLSDSIYLRTAAALKFKAINLMDKARAEFEDILLIDPYNIDILDTYSNILYLQQDIMKLSHLARDTLKHAKFRPETCYIIGNLYNAANLHNEAATYFKQALLLNPNYIPAWTLLGHEFIETKNVTSAMAAYKRAVELDPLEYRAWFGLAQVFELLKMPLQALPLFKKAYCLRPTDSKLSLAVARVYEVLGRKKECIDMLYVSVESGDPEGLSTSKLAGLLENSDPDRAASLYQRFLTTYDDKGMALVEDSAAATRFLMDYFFERQKYEEAEAFARRGCRYNQALKHSELVLQKIDKLMAQGVLKRKARPLVPTRNLLTDDPDTTHNHSDMDMGYSP